MKVSFIFFISGNHNKLLKSLNLLFFFIVIIFVAKICNTIFGPGQVTLEEISSDNLNGIEVKIHVRIKDDFPNYTKDPRIFLVKLIFSDLLKFRRLELRKKHFLHYRKIEVNC